MWERADSSDEYLFMSSLVPLRLLNDATSKSLCSRLAILLPSGSSSTLPPPPPVQGLFALKPCVPALSPRVSALSSQRCCYPEPYHSLDIRLHCLMRGCHPRPYHSPETH
ncbi:hypothetical protein J437_LFUL007950 [Ladona fulva]|uniref:Uncharacterized protein n=1 Tax=Ladona fulva TaxID=123851 RepID=A0A8K0KEZ2_LADFU|nr:hypothetical protein J437_LFUL007950 [Ladona fulva]